MIEDDANVLRRVSGHLEARKSSKFFYAIVRVGSAKETVPLRIAMMGKRPESFSQLGDKQFELSRARAQDLLEQLLSHLRAGGTTKTWKNRYAVPKKARLLPIANLEATWLSTFPDFDPKIKGEDARRNSKKNQVAVGRVGERSPTSSFYLKQVRSLLVKFVAWCVERRITLTAQLTPDLAAAFVRDMHQSVGSTPNTSNKRLSALQGVFSRLARRSLVSENPFRAVMPEKILNIVNHDILTPNEVAAMMRFMESNPEFRDIAVLSLVAISSSLRKIDCATFRWENVLFDKNVLSIMPAKRGRLTRIPMVPRLRALLEVQAQEAGPNPTGPVFPELSELYCRNPDYINDRFILVLKAIGISQERIGDQQKKKRPRPITQKKPAENETPEEQQQTEKNELDMRVRREKKEAKELARRRNETPQQKALREAKESEEKAEKERKQAVMEQKNEERKALREKEAAEESERKGRLERQGRKRAPARLSFASLRTSFVTWGLDAGILDHQMAEITGHNTVAHIRKNYYRADDANMRAQINKMPSVITGSELPSAPVPPVAVAPSAPAVVNPPVSAEDPAEAFLEALAICTPANVLGLKDTLRFEATRLSIADQNRNLIHKAINRLTESNLAVLRPSLIEWARGPALEKT